MPAADDYYPGVMSLQLAPNGVVRQIYPLKGNEKALGHNLLADPARNKEAFIARNSGQMTLAGPFHWYRAAWVRWAACRCS
jgi:sensor domain CHASE-containing protein